MVTFLKTKLNRVVSRVREGLVDKSLNSPAALLKRFCIVVVFGIAFAYIEAAVVVYLRAIFYPAGFVFPLVEFGVGPLWKKLLLIEVGKEAATLAVIFSGAWLIGGNRRQRFAFLLVIFAVWDIFYYLWLKALVNWPASVMDWDILFLIPAPWASAVIAPLLISLTMLAFAVVILYSDLHAAAVKVAPAEWLGFVFAALIVVVSFCIAGAHITEPDYKSYFYWPLFALGELSAVALFLRCFFKRR